MILFKHYKKHMKTEQKNIKWEQQKTNKNALHLNTIQ